MRNFIGRNGFTWFVGVVEDRNDPIELGRVRVRAFGWHTDDKGAIPTDSLPWAVMINSIDSASVSGVGKSPIQFISEILPIFQNNCTMCHGGLSGVSLTTQGEVLNSIGEQYGTKIIIPGDSENSPLINKINSSFPQFGSRMPLDNPTYFENFPEKSSSYF